MRRTTLARGGALLTAAALALSLSAGPATADSTQTEKAASVSDTAEARTGPPATGSGFSAPSARAQKLQSLAETTETAAIPADITTFSFSDGVLFRAGENSVDGLVDGTQGSVPIDHIDMNLSLNGVPKGTVTLLEDEIGQFVDILNTVGAGKAQLGPSTIHYTDGSSSVDDTMSNYFQLRRLTKSTNAYGLVITRSGSRITFKAQNWKIFKPSTGTYVPMNTIKLQYKDSAGNWLTRKTIELNAYGTGSYSTITSTKRRYRLYYPTTDTILGSRTVTSALI